MPIQLKHSRNDGFCLKISFENIQEGERALLTFLKWGHLGCAFKDGQELNLGISKGREKSGSKGFWEERAQHACLLVGSDNLSVQENIV